MVAMLVAW